MATYYWTGKVSSNVQDVNNWSLWGPSSGITLPPAAPTKPVNGSDVVLAKYPTTYPIYGPAGFLSGTSGGTLAVSIATLQVKEDFNKDIGISSNYFKFFAKEVDLNRASSGYTLAYIDIVEDPAGICGEDGNALVNVKAKASGCSFYIKGKAWQVQVPQVGYQTFAKIYGYGSNSYFACLSGNATDEFYFDSTTITPRLYSPNGEDITETSGTQYFFGSPKINISQGYSNTGILLLSGTNLTMNLTQTGISGSNPLDLPYTLFNSLNIGIQGGGNSNSNIINSYHETFIETLSIQHGTLNFNDPSTVSVITSGNFYPDKAVLTTTANNNLEIATLTVRNTNGTDVPNIKLFGNYDITAYPNDPLA